PSRSPPRHTDANASGSLLLDLPFESGRPVELYDERVRSLRLRASSHQKPLPVRSHVVLPLGEQSRACGSDLKERLRHSQLESGAANRNGHRDETVVGRDVKELPAVSPPDRKGAAALGCLPLLARRIRLNVDLRVSRLSRRECHPASVGGKPRRELGDLRSLSHRLRLRLLGSRERQLPQVFSMT